MVIKSIVTAKKKKNRKKENLPLIYLIGKKIFIGVTTKLLERFQTFNLEYKTFLPFHKKMSFSTFSSKVYSIVETFKGIVIRDLHVPYFSDPKTSSELSLFPLILSFKKPCWKSFFMIVK